MTPGLRYLIAFVVACHGQSPPSGRKPENEPLSWGQTPQLKSRFS
jgi:hypothetical protein